MALAPLGGVSALRRVLDRCRLIAGVDMLVCIAPDTNDFDELAAEAALSGALVVRGDGADPLGLCARAASETGADTIIHLGADSPFIDPALCARMLALLAEAEADYSCNDLPATWPHGLDCEIFPARLLHWADALATEPEQRARATSWLRFNPDLRKASLTGPGGDFAHLRWLLQWPEDLSFAQAVFEHLGERAASVSASELAALCLRRPDIPALNAKRNDTLRLTATLHADFSTPPLSLSSVA
jgi:spore coat polysaccharide biosynthesis protein SpsF (cytidylyltransferase family)